MKRLTLLLSIALVLFFGSCSPQYLNEVRKFSKTNDSISVLILRPSNIFYTNYKMYRDIEGLDTMSSEQKEKLLREKSDFLCDLNNDKINSLFVDEIIKEMCRTNLNVYTAEYSDAFYKLKEDKRVIVDLQQLEFDEFMEVVKDQYVDITINNGLHDTIEYNKETYLNGFAANVWLNCFSPYYDSTSILFATNSITDFHQGYYEKDYNGDVLYYEDNIPLTDNHIEQFIGIIAKRYAGYMYDYILNGYMKAHHPEVITFPENLTLHYTIGTNRVSLVDESMRFEKITK